MANKCPTCHSDNPDTLKFCGECGTQLPPPQGHPPAVTKTLQTPIRELTTGSMFAGRYQVIEELGHGGMGRVYRVLDQKLDEEVALKLIKPEIAADKETIKRFHNELRLARKIAHRNVGKMYELMEDRGTHFITMEYVPGQDLKGLIRQMGQLTAGKAVSIAKQICEGLAEAHRLGVVHRDLKPGNILIDKDGNARITDFGIARSLSGKGITGSGVMIGTPEYMSPEQVEGKDVDQRSDIYSLGIILYEMITGRVPFEGDTALVIAVKQKTEIPRDPREINTQIPQDLGELVLKCLEKDKAKRHQSAGELHADLDKIEQGLPTTERHTPERKPITSKEITVKFQPKKLILRALAVVAVIAAAVIFWSNKPSSLDPNLVAVAVFENKTGDPKLDPIGSRAAERIMQGLAQVTEFSVAPMPSAEALAAEARSKDKLRALAEATKAGKIVHGDYFLQGETIQFHAWVQDMAAEKNIVPLEPAGGPAADPDAALEPLRLKLMGGLAGVFDPMLKDSIALLKEPPNFEAFREFMEGLKKMMRGEYAQAVPNLLKAEEVDPKLKVALLYVSHAYWNQGQAAKADEFAQTVEKSRAELSTYERLFLDLTQSYVRGDVEAQLRIARQMVALSKRHITIYLNAANANRNNYPREAVAVLSQYDPTNPAMKDWSRNYWGVLTTARHMLGNHKRELKEARRSRKQLPDSLLMLAHEVDALAALGRTKELQRLFEESKTLPPMRGYSPGDIMLRAGRELRAHGFREESVRVLDQALQWYEARPSEEKGSLGNRYSRATTLYVLGQWVKAKTMFEGLQTDAPDDIAYLGYIGATAARMEDREGAARASKQLEEDHRPYLFGNPTYWRARIAALLGDREAAVNLLRQTTKEGFSYSSIHPTEDFESLADYPPYIQMMKPKG